MNRRRVVRLVLAVAVSIAAWALLAPAVHAQETFRRFYPFLIDLQGWNGKEPDGFAVEMHGTNMATASREYLRGNVRLSAQVVTGPAAQGALATTRTAVDIETGDAHMRTSTIDGLPVAQTYTVHDKSGTVLVALGSSAMFSISFKGLGEDEALTLARQFDWKAIQQALVPR